MTRHRRTIRHAAAAVLATWAVWYTLGTAGAQLPSGGLLPPPANASFPALPPPPEPVLGLGELDQELATHGGAHLYVPGGDLSLLPPEEFGSHHAKLRVPEDWHAPQPFTLFAPFLGTGPIHLHGKWPGPGGYAWEPRFVFSGSYEVFGFGLGQANREQLAIGHQLTMDFDLRLTGTERFHVQYRPLGRDATGGSYYQFTNPEGYVDASTAEPSRYWFEGDLSSMLGSYLSPFGAWDINITAGKFPFAAHNTLLINDELLGVVVSQDTIRLGTLSNLNLQALYFFNDVDTSFRGGNDGQIVGLHASADRRHAFYEATYAYWDPRHVGSGVHYIAVSRTQFYGAYTLAARGLFKFAAPADRGNGQLLVLEANRKVASETRILGFEPSLIFANFYIATSGWQSIAGSNFNRLQTAFEISPLVNIASGVAPDDRWGMNGGVQWFRHHEDESLTTEIAVESIRDRLAGGLGIRYQRKLSARTWWELLAIANASADSSRERYGAFARWFVLW